MHSHNGGEEITKGGDWREGDKGREGEQERHGDNEPSDCLHPHPSGE
jgi:hypothetical protein